MLKFSISTAFSVVVLMGIVLLAQNPLQNAPQPLGQRLPGAPQQQQQQGTGSISGTVVEMGSNVPIPGASVELRRIDCNNFSNPPEVFNVKTDHDGKFNFPNLHAGGWCIVATAAGGKFTPAEYLQRGYKGRGVTIPLTDGEKIPNITLTMAPTSAISGHITDRDGEPVGHARVQAMELYYENGERRLYILQVVQTNDLGEYRFYWLPPGRYFVAAIPDDILRQNVAFSIPPPGEGGHREDQLSPIVMRRIAQTGEVIEETYVPMYYGDVIEAQRSTPIDLLPGTSVTGMNISLRNARIRSWHIRGTAINGATGMPAAGAQLRLMPRSWTATVIMPNVQTDAEGHFDLKGVLPGSYILYANQAGMAAAGTPAPTTPAGPRGVPPAPGANAAAASNPCAPPPPAGAPPAAAAAGPPPIPPVAARVPIDIGNSNAENVSLTMTPGYTLMGKVTLENPPVTTDGSGPRGMRVALMHDPDLVGLPGAPQGAVQANGTFCLANVAQGDYHVYVPPLLNTFQWGTSTLPTLLQNGYIKSIRLGGTDVLSNGLRLNFAPQEPLEVLIGNGAKLSGTVVNEKRESVVNATVALVPTSSRERLDLYRTTTSDKDGRYKLQGIPPGSYRAFAWEDVERDAWQDPGFLTLIEGRGTTVQVSEGMQADADLIVIPAVK
jgi:5-hydroxyisourate hydrolase-like protein (transthyretin family)